MKRFSLNIDIDNTQQLADVLHEIATRYEAGGIDNYHSGSYDKTLNARDEDGEIIGRYKLVAS